MPAPTEQHAQDQRSDASDASDVSDARKRIDEYLVSHRVAGVGSFIVSTLDRRDIESVLADADRDRQFAEAVRASARDESTRNGGAINLRGDASPCFRNDILNAHQRIYGTPCTPYTAKEGV